MKPKFFKSVLSLVFSATMSCSAILPAMAATDPKPVITVTGSSGDSTIKVVEKTEENVPYEDKLDLFQKTFSIARDYSQKVLLPVFNCSASAKNIYAVADGSTYPDLSLEFIRYGTQDNPIAIGSREKVNLELSIFAQNATSKQYLIPVTIYQQQEDGSFQPALSEILTVNCKLPTVELAWTQGNTNPNTLQQSWTVKNDGDNLSDLTISASQEIADYVYFSPTVSNLALSKGDTVEFEVIPDLAKMKQAGVKSLSGKLIAQGGGSQKEQAVTFDAGNNEIEVTTMGKIALEQDDNPFSNFEFGPDWKVTGSNGSAPTKVSDVLSEDGTSKVSIENTLDLGIEGQQTKVGIDFSTKPATEVPKDKLITAELKPGSDNKSIELHLTYYLSKEEKNQFIAQAKSGQLTAVEQVMVSTFANGQDDDVDYGLVCDTVLKLNDGLDATLDADDPTGLGVVGDILDAGSLVSTGVKATRVAYSTKYTTQQKLLYTGGSLIKTICTGGKAAVSMVNPVVGFCFSLALWPMEIMLDKYLDSIYDNPIGVEVFTRKKGSQCTNRGKIATQFHAPNHKGGKPSLHVSERMYGEGYVNKEDTNYDIYLNGEKTGTVENEGLTEVSFADVDTEYLKPGQTNEIVFDYDTSPGSHAVSTDTEITIIYPPETEFGYINDPENPQNFNLKPDFAIYPENIYSTSDPIINEPSILSFNVYNRGSLGGWFSIKKKVNGSEQQGSDEVFYLPAFSGDTFELEYTPTSASTTVSIEIVNQTLNAGGKKLAERSSENNTAEKTIAARSRQVPVIKELETEDIYENKSFSLDLKVENYADIESAEFTINQKTIQSSFKDSGNVRTYSLFSQEGISQGEQTLNISIKYKTSSNTTTTVTGTKSFTVKPNHTITVSLNSALKAKECYLLNSSGSRLEASSTQANTYAFDLRDETYSKKVDYIAVVRFDNGLYISGLDKDIITVKPSDLKQVSFKKLDSDQILEAFISSVELNGKSFSLGLPVSSPFLVSPGKYSLSITLRHNQLASACYQTQTITDDTVIDLTTEYKDYEFTLPAGEKAESYSARLFYKQDTYWTSYDFTYSSTKKDNKLSVTVIPAIQQQIGSAETFIEVAGPDRVWYSQYQNGKFTPSQLKTEDLCKVSLKPQTNGVEFKGVSVSRKGYPNSLVKLKNNVIYLPKDTFTIVVDYQLNGESLKSVLKEKQISKEEEFVYGSELGDLVALKFDWPQALDAAAPEITTSADSTDFSFENVERNTPVQALKGLNRFSTELSYQNYLIRVSGNKNLTSDGTITIGDTFTGALNVSGIQTPAGTSQSLYFYAPTDNQGNSLDYAYKPYGESKAHIVGQAVFTSKEEGQESITIPVKSESLTNCQVTVPDIPGEYTVSLTLQLINIIYCNVKFINDSNEYASQQVEQGECAAEPSAPTKAGYKFDGWYLDQEYTKKFNFLIPVNEDLTLYAKWTKDETQQDTPSGPTGGGGISGGGGSTQPEQPTETVVTKNPDGSTTTTTTDPNTGVKTEVTEGKADGSKETVVTQKDGSKTTTIESQDGTKGTVSTNSDGSYHSGSIQVGEQAASTAKQNGTAVQVNMPSIPADHVQDDVALDIQIPEAQGTIEVSIPVVNENTGSVAMIKEADGSLTPVPKSKVKDGRIIVPLEKGTTIVIKDNAKSFPDIPNYDRTAYPGIGVAYVSARGILNGQGNGSFDLEGKVSRGMIARILYNLEGSPDVSGKPVPVGVNVDWYRNAATWAADSGLMAQGSNFRGDDLLTREQLAMILWRYENKPEPKGDLSAYSPEDQASISSSEMRKAVSWAVGEKIMGQGSPLTGQRDGSRAEVSNMLYRFLNK